MSNEHKTRLRIDGMHCASCEVLLEQKFSEIPGVLKVQVNQATGIAEIVSSRDIRADEFEAVVKKGGYRLRTQQTVQEDTKLTPDYHAISGMVLVVVAGYLLLKKLDLLPNLQVSDAMSYGFIFLMGLVAAVSTCMAVTGGLLLAVSAKYNERFPTASAWQKFLPQLSFNVGRVLSYGILGAIVGSLGSVIAISPRANGILIIIVSVVMILLGFDLLRVFPGLKRFYPRMPKFIAHRVHDLGKSNSPIAPFLLGAGTFFLPCGFTQALQLYVLSTGDALKGGLTMLVFSLGTLPALLFVSAVSSIAKGSFQKQFLHFAGVVVILLGVLSVRSGFALAGFSVGSRSSVADSVAQMSDGKQIVRMRVQGLEYEPAQFTVRAGVPVEWHIEGSGAAGCARVVTLPAMGISELLPSAGEKVITFTPTRPGKLAFSCGMGMTTPGASFIVIPNDASDTGSTDDDTVPFCDPTIANCLTS